MYHTETPENRTALQLQEFNMKHRTARVVAVVSDLGSCCSRWPDHDAFSRWCQDDLTDEDEQFPCYLLTKDCKAQRIHF